MTGQLANISASGCLLHLPGLAAQAAYVELQLELPGGTVRTRARVVWRGSADRVGVEFKSFEGDGLAALAEFYRAAVAATGDAPVRKRKLRLWKR